MEHSWQKKGRGLQRSSVPSDVHENRCGGENLELGWKLEQRQWAATTELSSVSLSVNTDEQQPGGLGGAGDWVRQWAGAGNSVVERWGTTGHRQRCWLVCRTLESLRGAVEEGGGGRRREEEKEREERQMASWARGKDEMSWGRLIILFCWILIT